MGSDRGSSHLSRTGFLQVWERLEWCEALLGQAMSAPAVALRAQKPPPDGLGLPRTTANRYVGAVLARLQRDAVVEPIESKRARMAAFWRAQADRAINRTRTIISPDGSREIQVIEADLRAANQAGLALMQLEGLALPSK